MKIYVLEGVDFDDHWVVGVFSTKEKAKFEAKELERKDKRHRAYTYFVEEYEVDQFDKKR